jgi:WD repeat-containing protein 76
LSLSEVLQEDDNVNDVPSLTADWENTSKHRKVVGDPSAFAYEDNKQDERETEELKKKLQSLKVVSRAKVTQDRIYSAAYHPEPTKDLIFFGGMLSSALYNLWH